MSKRRAAAIVVGALLAGGCATMAHGGRQDVIINSEPPGAHVSLNGKDVGITPCVGNFPRKSSNLTLRFQLTGYDAQEIRLRREDSAWVWADLGFALNPVKMQGMSSAGVGTYLASSALALGWTLGLDLLTGAAYKLPRRVSVTLNPEKK